MRKSKRPADYDEVWTWHSKYGGHPGCEYLELPPDRKAIANQNIEELKKKLNNLDIKNFDIEEDYDVVYLTNKDNKEEIVMFKEDYERWKNENI